MIIREISGNLALARYLNCGGSFNPVTTCPGSCSGSITSTQAFGTSPFSYDSLINLPAGIFTFTITDANGCVISFTDTLVDQPDFVWEYNQQNDFEIIPNPTTGKFEIRMLIDIGRKYKIESIEIFNVVGEKKYTAFDINCQVCIIDCSGFPRGIYFVKLNNEKVNCVKKLAIE